MNRRERRRQSGKSKQTSTHNARDIEDMEKHPISKTFKTFTLKPRNKEQSKYINLIKNSNFVICSGTVGSGKTFIPAVIAAQMLQEGLIEKIYIVRPNVELGRPIGFLKGTMYEKTLPWIAPVLDGLSQVMEESFIKYLMEKEVIQAVPIAYLRGRTFSNCFVIGDELQNTEIEEMECFCQRQGDYSKVVITGDIKQKDIAKNRKSGLEALLKITEMYERCPYFSIQLTECVRSDEAQFAIEAFEALREEGWCE